MPRNARAVWSDVTWSLPRTRPAGASTNTYCSGGTGGEVAPAPDRGLHSSTVQLNVSTFRGAGDGLARCVYKGM